MDLVDTSQLSKTQYTGQETVEIPGGKTLGILTSPDGERILAATVPEGKTWTVRFNIEIVET